MALGRGLSAILEEVGQAYDTEVGTTNATLAQIREIDVTEISPNPYQPRKMFEKEALRELSESIQRHGLLQPIVVIEKDDGYLLVAGERRLRAHKLAKIESIKCVVADVAIDDAKLRELALIENIQRENLNAMELAHSYDELIKVYAITHDELSHVVNKSRSQITNTLRLLNLSETAQDALIKGKISQGHAKVLIALDEKEQQVLVNSIIGQKLSVRDLEALVSKKKNKKNSNNSLKEEANFTLPKAELEELLKKLPFTTKIKKQSVEILLHSKEELEDFIHFIKKQ